MHRVGGLEKKDGTGNIDYTPENHEHMVHLRADKIAAIAADIPPTEINGDPDADVLFIASADAIIGVSIIPGEIVITLTPIAARSRARGSVIAATPPLDAAYAACPIRFCFWLPTGSI